MTALFASCSRRYEIKKRTFQDKSSAVTLQKRCLKIGLSSKKNFAGPPMMVFFKERLVYLAVPKTGTTAIERALSGHASAAFRDPPGIKHTNALGFERKIRPLYERWTKAPLETCAVMRHPIDWLGSWFRYRQRPALKGHKNSTAGLTFDEFVTAYLQEDQPPFAEVGSQARFVSDQDGELLVNHLFQYEDIGAFHRFLKKRLGQPIETKKVNPSPKAQIELSPNIEKNLRDRCAMDFQIHEALNDGPLSID